MYITGGNVFINGNFIRSDIKIENDIISAIGCQSDCEDTLSCDGKYIIPGLVDIHTHGCAGFDFSSASPDEIAVMQKYYLENGITSILATTVSLSDENIIAAVNNIRTATENQTYGAKIEGINLEGPYLSPKKCGAHDASLLKKPDISFINQLGDFIKVVNVAPEYENASDFIVNFPGKTSIAHTDCNYEAAKKAIALGADHITHIFNAMNGLHHRNPGVIGAFFDSEAIAEMICDGIHIALPILKMMFDAYPERIAIISDSMAATGLSDGNYKLGNLDVNVKNSIASLSDGTLAGSAMNIFKMMHFLISNGIKPEKVIRSVTEIPAKSVGLDNVCGIIAVGRKADILILNKDFTLDKILFNGKIISFTAY